MVKSWKISSASPLHRKVVPPGALSPMPGISRADVFDGLCGRVTATFSTTLGLYRNLASLEMRGLSLDARVRNTLDSLRRFEELTLDSCYIAHCNGPSLKLQRFTICGPPGRIPRIGDDPAAQDSLKVVSPARIIRLHLHARGEMSPLLTGFGGMPLPYLVHLSFHDPSDFDLLLVFLKQCPQLESLVIKLISVIHLSVGAHLHRDAVPFLRKLTAPAKMIGLFTPNRPISAVTILSENSHDGETSAEDLKNIFLAISRTSVPLQSLSISDTSSTIETSAAITAIFPELNYLSMAVPENHISPFRICGGSLRFGPDFSDDANPWELDDETAFDDPPAEEISDCEDDPAPLPWAKLQPTESNSRGTVYVLQNRNTRVPYPEPLELANSNYHKFSQDIQWRTVSFPPNLEALTLRVPYGVGHLYSEDHDELVAALSRQYPRLREVTMDYSSGESVWEVSGFASYSCTQRNRPK
ncbi:hypothetical protein B0H19DRAFT_1069377 [Mycena capillaripes]|nr:hypothetical protein B0H19DRAFT_1069377 [Mycena capillaripes]